VPNVAGYFIGLCDIFYPDDGVNSFKFRYLLVTETEIGEVPVRATAANLVLLIWVEGDLSYELGWQLFFFVIMRYVEPLCDIRLKPLLPLKHNNTIYSAADEYRNIL